MLKNSNIFGKWRPATYVLLWLSIFLLVFSSFPLRANAEEIRETNPDNPSFETSSHCDIYHAHRGSSTASGECYQTPVYHVHNGNASSGGACYTGIKHKHSNSCYTSLTCTASPTTWEIESYRDVNCSLHGTQNACTYKVYLSHSACGLGTSPESQGGNCNVCGGNVHSYTHEYKKLTCKKTTSTIDSYNLTCGKTEGATIESYALSCPLEEQKYGSLELTSSTSGWTGEDVTLSASLEDPTGAIAEGGYGSISFYDGNGNLISNSSSALSTSENGTYKARLSVNPSKFDSVEVMLNISNIDHTPPQINDLQYNTDTEWISENQISFSSVDIQPDNSPGSGLATSAFSFNGGADWQDNPSYTARINGDYEILSRDNCGNIARTNVSISNIDNEGPHVEIVFDKENWFEGDPPLNIEVNADDSQSGLSEHAYSHDGGITWTAESTREIAYEGSYNILVSDRCGNITSVDYQCSYSPLPKPEDNPPLPEPAPPKPPRDDPDKNTDTEDDSDSDSDSGNDDSNEKDDSGKDIDTKKKKTDNSEHKDEDSIPLTETENSNSDTHGSEDGSVADDQSASSLDTDNSGEQSGDNSDVETDEDKVLLPSSDASVPPKSPAGTFSYTPFYKTTGFKVASTVSGLLIAFLGLLFLFLFLFSGVLIYNYDGSRYRLTGFLPIHLSARGYCINLPEKMYTDRYSGKFRLHFGTIFSKRHKNDKMFIHYQSKWIPVEVSKTAEIEI